MELTKGHYYFILSIILASLRPLFYKRYKDYFFMTVYLSLLSMYIGGIAFMYYKLEDKAEFLDKILDTLSRENLLNSLISELRFILKQFAVVNLPLTVSIPMNNLWMVSSTYFGKVINNEVPTMKQIISIIFLIIGSIILNLQQILDSRKGKKMKLSLNYYRGIISLIASTVLGGYIFSVFKNISTKTQDSGYTMAIESGGALIVATFILIYDVMFCKKINIPTIKNIFLMFIALTFLFNIDILLRFYGLSKIKQLDTIYLSQIGTIIPLLTGIFYYKEKLDKFKIAGLFTILMAVFYGS